MPKSYSGRGVAANSALATVMLLIPVAALGQATSPFMTGATSLQTNILAWLTPIAIILVICQGVVRWAGGDARREP